MKTSSKITCMLFALISTCSVVMAEVAACSCAPSRFTFRLDFNRTCDDNSVEIGKTKGIDRSFCRTDDSDIFGGGENQSPVVNELSSILILELDSSLQVIKQHFRDGLGLMNGQTLQYSSIVADEEGAASTSDENMVAAIQMALTGATADGVEIQSQFILTYTNLCTIDVFRVGNAISWLVVVSRSGACTKWVQILVTILITIIVSLSLYLSRTTSPQLQATSAPKDLFLT